MDSNWSAEEFLTGEFENNLGSHCKLIAKDGKITGEYFKDGALLTMIVTYKLEGVKENGLEKYSQAAWNGKVYAAKKDFKMNWLLVCNEDEKNEWAATNLGQDHFVKKN